MHDASSGLGLISVDLAGVCVCMYSCEAVRGGPAVVPFVRNGSQAGPMTRSALGAVIFLRRDSAPNPPLSLSLSRARSLSLARSRRSLPRVLSS